MPSFDIVSRTDLPEVDNALQGAKREISTRYDFKGSKCSIERNELVITLNADDEFKLKQMQELMKGHMGKRKVNIAAFDFAKPEDASGSSLRQAVTIKLRVTGKKRDDLQDVIQLVKDLKITQPLQYVNMRD